MGLVVACIAPEMVPSIWDRVEGFIEAGYAAGNNCVPEDIQERFAKKEALLWVVIDDETGKICAAVTTELLNMKDGLTCWICQCGGENVRDWVRFHSRIEEYAKAEGCVKLIVQGRRGWERLLQGFQVRTVQLEKQL